MLGLPLAILSALLWAILDAQRKSLTRRLSPPTALVFLSLGAILLLALGLPLDPPKNWTSWRCWGGILGSGAINLVANLLFFRAIQISPLSLTIPYLSFTPIFMLLSGALWLREYPSFLAIFGILTVFVGAIVINPNSDGRFSPFRAILRERGSLYMLCVAFLWSHTGPLEKIALQDGSPTFVSLGVFVTMSTPLFLWLLLRRPQEFQTGLRDLPLAFLASLTMLAATLSQLVAFRFLYVVYVDTIKRSGAIFAVLIGYFFFQERPLRPRLLGAILMVLGVSFVIGGR